MTGENEHDRENADDQSTPGDSELPFISDSAAEPAADSAADSAADPSFPAGEPEMRSSRRFRAWGAAKREETGPSLFQRASDKLKGMFSKPKAPEAEPVYDESESVDIEKESIPMLEAHAEEPALIEEPAVADEPALIEEPVAAEADEPKENLAFLRTAETDSFDEPIEAAVIPEAEDLAHEGPTADTFASLSAGMDAPQEPVEEAPPPKKRASLLKRIFFQPISFSRSKKPEVEAAESVEEELVPDTGETEVPDSIEFTRRAEPELEAAETPEAQPEEVQSMDASLDEALPMDPVVDEAFDAAPEADATTPEPEPEPPKKIGFFGRIFGRKSVEAPPPEPVESGIESEPVDADAVGQLDAVDQGFEAARSELAPPEHTGDPAYATVDDALPFDTPPALSEANVPAAASDEHSFFGGNTFDFDTPKADDRSTMEVTPVDDRKTAEVTASDAIAHADEVERKTDEFEMVELDGATLQEPAVGPLEGKTAEVPKVSIFKKIFGRTKEVTQVEPAVAPPPSANPTFLVQKFRTFYNEVVVYKNQKAELTAGFATAIVTSYDADLSPEQAAQSLSQRLQQMLELQLAESSWMGGEIHDLYPDAQYAMAVLADEMLSNMEWPGQGAWGKHRLELTVFKTAASDLELFKRIDKLLKTGPQTVGTRDLARVYLLTIASGFKGKYRPFDLPRALAEYRRRLYEFVYNGDALLLYADERRIFPEATSATVAGKGVKRFSHAQQWAAILVLLLAGYTVISHMAWRTVSADLKDIAARVEEARNPAPPDSPNGGGGR